MELWSNLPNILSVGLTSPSGESSNQIFIRSNGNTVFSFLLDKTVLYLEYRIAAEGTTSELISLRFQDPTSEIWKLQVQASQLGDGNYHIWLPVREFLSTEVYFLESDPNMTMTSAGDAQSAITVGYYNGTNQSIGVNSGRGFTRENQIKPDLTAPGDSVQGVFPGERLISQNGSSSAAGDYFRSCSTFAGVDLRAAFGAKSGRGRAEKPSDPGSRPERRNFLSIQRMGLWNVESGKCIFTNP